MKPPHLIAILIILVFSLNHAQADSLRLVKDIRTGISSEIKTRPPVHAMVGQRLFFANADKDRGLELWVSDGTSAGTYLLKDVFPGAASSDPDRFVVANGVLYFTALHPDAGRELWRSDGTAAGTRLVRDIRPGFEPSGVQFATAIGGTLYFAADDGVSGAELWKTDGTTAGTVKVKDINPGAASSSPHDFAVLNNILYFGANDGIDGDELWRSDGTAGGTKMVKDLRPGGSSTPTLLTVGNGVVYFSAKDSNGQDAIWKTDGSASGTSLLLQVSCARILFVNNRLFFTKLVDPYVVQAGLKPNIGPILYPHYELWTSDGTQAGTSRIFSAYPRSEFIQFVAVGSKLYFGTTEVPFGIPWGGCAPALYRVDTVTNALEQIPGIASDVRDIVAFAGKSCFLNNAGLQVIDSATTPTLISPPGEAVPGFLDANSNRMIFGRFPEKSSGSLAWSGTGQLWCSDGTAGGTVKFGTLQYRTWSGVKAPFAETNGTAKFLGMDEEHGQEVWRSDLSEAGTKLLVDLVPGAGSSYAGNLVSWRGALYFTGSDAKYIGRLWRSDGTVAGTQPIFTLPVINNAGSSLDLFPAASCLWFVLRSPAGGLNFQLWKSDGTAAETVMVKSFPDSWVECVAEVGGLLYFNVLEDGNFRLWRTDGTPGGTFKINSSAPDFWSEFNGLFYFMPYSSLWKTDGTVANTTMISSGSHLMYLVRMGGNLYCLEDYGMDRGPKLLKINGASVVSTVDEGTTVSAFSGLISYGSSLFYTCETTRFSLTRDLVVRKSDGTPAGCIALATFPDARNVRKQLTTDGKLFLSVLRDPAVYGRSELWVSDGTPAGTTLLKSGLNLVEDGYDSDRAVGTRFFFTNNAASGKQLWVSDGTAAGTKMLMLLEPDETVLTDLGPDFFLKGDGRIVIAANDGVWGKELWAYVPEEVEILAPKAGDVVANGGWLTIRWRTDTVTAGSVVRLELWKGSQPIAILRDAWGAGGTGIEQIALPPVQPGSDYRIRAVSETNSSLQAWSAYFTVTGQPRNAAGAWMLYR
ncbi:hypothetical protein LLG95_10070 [bacterium]|nr:hypothetical protein [bacterium]